MSETIYYNSPVGILQIINSGDAISKIGFINTAKTSHTNESEIIFEEPVTGILKDCITQLNAYFAGTRTAFDLPLSQPGSDFQQQVWKELCTIPFGKTSSYLALSKRLGNSKAIRAVGNANGKNAIAIIVPCHRVIGSNGDMVGYAGDLWRKKWLLEHEAKFASGVQLLF